MSTRSDEKKTTVSKTACIVFTDGSVSTATELRNKIKEDAENQFKQQGDQQLLNAVTEHLVENTTFDLPAAFLKKWLATAGEKPLTADEATAEFNKSEKSLRYQLIEGKIMKENNIKIDHAELGTYAKGFIRTQMAQFGNMNPEEKELNEIAGRVLQNKEEAQKLQSEYETKLEENTEAHKADVVEKVDSYLNYVVEEWMQENKIAIERGIKGEIAEDFIGGLKKLFEDHYIDVPDDKYNVLEDQASKIEDLEKKLNEEIEKNVTSHKTIGELKSVDIAKSVSEGLTDVEKEKFNKLAEEVEYSNEEDFTTKVTTIKESYFGKQEAKSDDLHDVAVSDGSTVEPADLTNSMAAYSAAISKTKDIKISK